MNLINRVFSKTVETLLRVDSRQKLSILIYHRVLPERDPMRPFEPTVDEFDWQMKVLTRFFQPISLTEAVSALDGDNLPSRAVCVTFDDGYADNEQFAIKTLQKWQVPATFFIATGFLNGGRMWNDSVIEAVRNARGAVLDLRQVGLDRFTLENINQRRQGAENIIASVKHRDAADREKLVEDIASIVGEPLPDDLMMSDAQVVNLRKNGMEIGAHTVNHLILRKMGDKSDAEKEIGESRRYLEALLGEAIDFFAYPNGKFDRDYSLDHRDLVESMGFRAALSTEWGVSNRATDRFQLPRFTPWDKTPLRFTGRLINNYRNLR